ncbi:hypothetical protein [Streptomyces sp. SID9124]|uniref:hypothetical protein n=1 Tax=Streptomyces sp. SID9124 TaxID=2706108 RepID=UPI0013DEA1FE|nr:hypothetical protein [Streptomyces sp. SID9124]NED16433.1 hypothetical protein [Streptomyces sp. SID9124]
MKRPMHLLVVVAVVGLLTSSCSGGSGNDAPGKAPASRTGAQDRTTAPPKDAAPKTQLSVPSLYDTSRGWESDLPGDQIPLPHSNAVAVFRQSGANTGTITVLDVTSGRRVWRAEVKGPGQVQAESVSVKGKDYLVTHASGSEGDEVLSKGRDLTTIDIFPALAAGDDVKPARHLALDGELVVGKAGSGLLVQLDASQVETVDVATGKTKKYDLHDMKPPPSECKLCFATTKAVAVTPSGLLLDRGGHHWVPGAWAAGSLTNGDHKVFIAPVQDLLVAQWHDEGAATDTWAVLDPTSGKVRAEVACEPTRGIVDDNGKGAALSANGRYLVRSHTAFDLEKKTGFCFEETDRDKPVQLNGVTDEGIAFGIGVSTSVQTDPRVTVDLTTGQAEAADYTVAPFSDYSGYGLFWDESTKTMVVYPHAK